MKINKGKYILNNNNKLDYFKSLCLKSKLLYFFIKKESFNYSILLKNNFLNFIVKLEMLYIF